MVIVGASDVSVKRFVFLVAAHIPRFCAGRDLVGFEFAKLVIDIIGIDKRGKIILNNYV